MISTRFRQPRRSGTLAAQLIFVSLALSGAFNAVAGTTPDPGVDCGCKQTGQYMHPGVAVGFYLGPGGISHNGAYVASLQPDSPGYDLQLTQASSGRVMTVVSHVALAQDIAYGFSPRDQAFAYFYVEYPPLGVSGPGVEYSALYNLAQSGSGLSSPIWTFEQTGTSSVGYGFSPQDNYLVFNAVTGQSSSELKVIDDSTGQIRFAAGLSYGGVAPTNNPVSVAGWGFSPDVGERHFVYAYTYAQTSSLLNLVDLDTGQILMTQTVNGATYGATSWSFSPCGDVFGIVRDVIVGGGADVNLYSTLDGTSIAAAGFHTQDIVLVATSTSQAAVVGGQLDPLVTNMAGASCNPSTVWVDFSYTGTEWGTSNQPYQTLVGAVNKVQTGGTIIIKAGSTSETPTITKALTIESYGGTSTIGQ